MDLPDCPPGAEGYEDTVTEVAKKDPTCTKAEQEFQEHLNSLKVKLEDGSTRPMVERSERDIAGKWIYLCYPCAAVCSGEPILQTHLSGKKHKTKLASMSVWPLRIFTDHPYHQQAAEQKQPVKQARPKEDEKSNKPIDQPHKAIDKSNKSITDIELLFSKNKNVRCHLQDTLDAVKAPLVGLEYLIEHPPEEENHEPKYICALCFKQGHPRTIINHITGFWHRFNYVLRHYPKAGNVLSRYRTQAKYREGVHIVTGRVVQRIEDTYGRMKPINIEKEFYDRNKDRIHQFIYNSDHFVEKKDCTFEEVIDVGLIESLSGNTVKSEKEQSRNNPSPPVVAAPTKPQFNSYSRPAGRQERRAGSMESLSDISDDLDAEIRRTTVKSNSRTRDRVDDNSHELVNFRSRYTFINKQITRKSPEKSKLRNYDYKVKLAYDKRVAAEEFAKKTLAYHEKNPEKHPLYPEEWKKFWNKRYKELQADGKDPSKHDFKPEWIVFWTARMKELHDQELRVTVNEIYRKMCLSPPDLTKKSPEPMSRSTESRRPSDTRRLSPEKRRRSPDPRRRSPPPKRRSPDPRRRSPDLRRRSPIPRRRSPDIRHRSPHQRQGSPNLRHRSPIRRDLPDRRRSPNIQRPTGRQHSIDRHQSPKHRLSTRSRSPIRKPSPHRTRVPLDTIKRSQSPLSQREMQPRNRSPEARREVAPSMQTVVVSDDDLKPDDGISPWNSDVEIASVESMGERSHRSRSSRSHTRPRHGPTTDSSAPDDVIATLRLLVALEDYLGSLGPKLVDLLAEALRMEKENANSSEELLVRESAMVLVETAKEKLKGAIQAGLVAGSAANAARSAVVRAAATLHEADKRTKTAQTKPKPVTSITTKKQSGVAVAGVGEVDRAQIAQQMAEALIAQGKTDVSSEELAQLVDAVVGMAEAKKREAAKSQPEVRSVTQQNKLMSMSSKASGTASALQMLQSAYDENDKRAEKEEAADAMDGLSDSDLETLLKNFNELSAEEQHSLIAYLKKLEAREPTRVERLRQYVSDAAHVTGPASVAVPPPQGPSLHGPAGQDPSSAQAPPTAGTVGPKVVTEPMVLDSDDDDYTVEEVFKSATQKVKEDKIRQEMEIVKKSLEETNTSEPAPFSQKPADVANNIFQNFSSASDLFALVQASVKALPAAMPASTSQPVEVVASTIQPRAFGDLPQSQNRPKPLNSVPILNLLSSVSNKPPPLLSTPLQNFINDRSEQSVPNEGNRPPSDFNQSMEPPTSNQQLGQGETTNELGNPSQPPMDSFTRSNQASRDHYNQEHMERFQQGPPLSNLRFNQNNQPPYDRFNQDKQSFNNRFNPGNQPPTDHFHQGNQPPRDHFNQGNQSSKEYQALLDHNQQENQQSIDFNQGNQQANNNFNQINQPTHDQFNPGYQPPNEQFNQNYQPSSNQDYPSSNDNYRNRRTNTSESRGPPIGGSFNQGPRPSFMNSRGQDNRQHGNQFNNHDNQNHYRGRGRGYFGGRGRGRY